jgi:hypothetical protein
LDTLEAASYQQCAFLIAAAEFVNFSASACGVCWATWSALALRRQKLRCVDVDGTEVVRHARGTVALRQEQLVLLRDLQTRKGVAQGGGFLDQTAARAGAGASSGSSGCIGRLACPGLG